MREIVKKIIIYILTKEAAAVLKKYAPKIIAITGTVGKTSTKEAVYAVLSQFEHVRSSPKSFNSDFGVPLAILGQNIPAKLTDLAAWLKVFSEGLMLVLLPSHYPKWLVLEVGTDRPGDIKEITKWLKPDIAIVTKLAEVPVHVEAFGSPERLFAEKGNLVKALKPGGTLILNGSDKKVMEYKDLTSENVVSYDSGDNYEVVYEGDRPAGIQFDIEGQKLNVMGTLGSQHMENFGAAMAVAKLLNENLAIAAKGLSRLAQAPGRMRLIEGVNGSTIIDDTYNSSPIAVEGALKTLKSLKSKRKIAILGDMLELGRYTVDEHRRVGERAAKTVKMLAAVGIRSRYTAEAALEAGMKEEQVFSFNDSHEAARAMKDKVKEGDLILIKGSQGMRMERVVEALMDHPEQKEKLLVRQGDEWKGR